MCADEHILKFTLSVLGGVSQAGLRESEKNNFKN